MADDANKGGSGRPSSFGRIGALLTGMLGVAVLIGLCVWQVQRLHWKEGVIAELETRLSAAPAPLPAILDPETQEYLRVEATGRFDGAMGENGFVDAPLITSIRPWGPGYRIIQPFETDDGRRILVDRGFVLAERKNRGGAAVLPTPAPTGPLTIIGALRWPDEGVDGPDFGARNNVWTDRDLGEMAAIFHTEPALIVAETSTSTLGAEWPEPVPISVIDVPNKHLEYAITWGLLALAWAVMTGWLAFRPVKPAPQKSSS